MAGIDGEWPMLQALIWPHWRINYEVADKAGSSAEILFGNLVTNRTGDAICGFGITSLVRIKGEMRKDFLLFSSGKGFVVRHRHVAARTFVLNVCAGARMVNCLSPNAGLPVGITRRVGHYAGTPVDANGEVLACFRFHTVVTCNAPVRGLKKRRRVRMVVATVRQTRKDSKQQYQNRDRTPVTLRHYHPLVNFPSAQSQSR